MCALFCIPVFYDDHRKSKEINKKSAKSARSVRNHENQSKSVSLVKKIDQKRDLSKIGGKIIKNR